MIAVGSDHGGLELKQAASGQPGWHGGSGQGSELDDALPAAPARLLGRGLVDAYA